MRMACVMDVLPFALMILIEIGEVGVATVGKKVMLNGLSNYVYVVYFNTIGTVLLSLYYIFHRFRNKGLPLTLSILCKFFILGLLGTCFVQTFSFIGINYSSPTLATALGNLIPAVTFLLAVIFRMEKVAMRSRSSQAKIIGTVVSISGAFVVTFYKGPPILIHLSSSSENSSYRLFLTQVSDWALGGFFIVLTCLSAGSWNIYQAAVIKERPEKLTMVFFMSLFGTIQCAIVALIAEPRANAWILHPGVEVLAVFYSGIFVVILRGIIFAWCLQKKGPVFVSLFKPLGVAIAVIMGIIFLGETPYVGSLMGAAVIASGFYTVMWGKAQEENVTKSTSGLESSSPEAPLLEQNT